jgi:hypothetical protein
MLMETYEHAKLEASFRKAARTNNKKPASKMAFEEDDLDDLDNLMGDSNKKVFVDEEDDDDFFGGGGNNDDEFVPKKKKNKGNDDPLAFL